MAVVTEGAGARAPDRPAAGGYTASAAVAVLVGAVLSWCAHSSALALLVAVAVLQALLAPSWVFGLRLPGRIGALVLAVLAAAAADTTASVWPRARLAALVAVFALAVPAMFVHQLARGAARVQVVRSLGGVAVLVLTETSFAALLQLRHEFAGSDVGSNAAVGVIAAATGALAVGALADLVLAAPRFDADVPRGVLAVVLSTVVGAAIGQLVLRGSIEFVGGRAVFTGAAVGALVALFAVAMAFLEHGAAPAGTHAVRRLRALLAVLVPLGVLAPVAFLLCLAVRA